MRAAHVDTNAYKRACTAPYSHNCTLVRAQTLNPRPPFESILETLKAMRQQLGGRTGALGPTLPPRGRSDAGSEGDDSFNEDAGLGPPWLGQRRQRQEPAPPWAAAARGRQRRRRPGGGGGGGGGGSVSWGSAQGQLGHWLQVGSTAGGGEGGGAGHRQAQGPSVAGQRGGAHGVGVGQDPGSLSCGGDIEEAMNSLKLGHMHGHTPPI